MENQIPPETQPAVPQQPQEPLKPEPAPSLMDKVWKIVGIFLLTIIVVLGLLVWLGTTLDDQSAETAEPSVDNKQQNTTMDNQNDNTSVEEYLVMQSESSDYRKFAEKVIEELGKGNTQYLRDNLSPSLVATNSQEAVDSIFLPAAKEMFANFDHIGKSVIIQPSTDSYGNSGYSYAMTAVYEDNTEKKFKIYVVEEGGRLVVGNIVE